VLAGLSRPVEVEVVVPAMPAWVGVGRPPGHTDEQGTAVANSYESRVLDSSAAARLALPETVSMADNLAEHGRQVARSKRTHPRHANWTTDLATLVAP
jgi:hypothetical protein